MRTQVKGKINKFGAIFNRNEKLKKTPHCKQCHSVQIVLPRISSGCGVLGSSFIGILPVGCSATTKRAVGQALEFVRAGRSRRARLAFPSLHRTRVLQCKVGVREAMPRCRRDPEGPHQVLWSLASVSHKWLPRLFHPCT